MYPEKHIHYCLYISNTTIPHYSYFQNVPYSFGTCSAARSKFFLFLMLPPIALIQLSVIGTTGQRHWCFTSCLDGILSFRYISWSPFSASLMSSIVLSYGRNLLEVWTCWLQFDRRDLLFTNCQFWCSLPFFVVSLLIASYSLLWPILLMSHFLVLTHGFLPLSYLIH